jgi:oxepin-CoA hydrolase/3-oxo-5,6-dehydrosuberyl-CoA semialdehyde dehydrogenase
MLHNAGNRFKETPMLKPESFIAGNWIAPGAAATPIVGPVTATEIALAGGASLDTDAMLHHARNVGGPALRALTFHDRAKILKKLALYIGERKEELYAINGLTGATRRDGGVDIEGGIGTLFVYASKGRRELPDSQVYADGEVEQLGRSGAFIGQHIATPLQGVAVHINAFNFPVWGMLEKLAPTLLAGVPAIVKPATQTCYLTEACFRMIIESGLLPDGAVQWIIGRTGDLLDKMGPQDVVSFTGSADTAQMLRTTPALIQNSTRFLAEQDSLNASILGADADADSPEFALFIKEAVTEITTKAGQKCTAMRRLLVPDHMAGTVAEALSAKLATITVGHPDSDGVRMGALASMAQKSDVLAKAAQIGTEARQICGDLADFQPVDADGEAAFIPPTLFQCDDPDGAEIIHAVEAFGPVSTILPYRDTAHAAALANRGEGSLVASVFTHDPAIARDITLTSAAWHGRLYINNRDTGREATGHGAPMPHMVHGGPGRAGGGEELGGIRGVKHYLQRTAIQGTPEIISAITGTWIKGAPQSENPTHPFQRTFNEIQIGETIHTGSRTVSMEDIEHFAHFTGDTFYAHMDEDAAQRNPFFPGRVAHGYLLLSFAAGLFVEPNEGPVLANTGLNGLSFQKPVSAGDSIKVALTCKRKTKRTAEYGEVAWNATLTNQDDEQVAEYELLTMVSYER